MQVKKPPKKKYDYQVKTMILGDSAVGKTSFLLKLINNQFSLNHCATIGIDIKMKEIEIDGKLIKVQIWDSAGQEKYKTINQTLYRGAIGLILVYSITDAVTFNNLEGWIKNIHEHAIPGISKVLIGNKCDMEDKRKVTREEGMALARKYNMEFLETSAKDGTNVQEALMLLGRTIKTHIQSTPEQQQPNKKPLNQNIRLENNAPRNNQRDQGQTQAGGGCSC